MSSSRSRSHRRYTHVGIDGTTQPANFEQAAQVLRLKTEVYVTHDSLGWGILFHGVVRAHFHRPEKGVFPFSSQNPLLSPS